MARSNLWLECPICSRTAAIVWDDNTVGYPHGETIETIDDELMHKDCA